MFPRIARNCVPDKELKLNNPPKVIAHEEFSVALYATYACESVPLNTAHEVPDAHGVKTTFVVVTP